MYSKPINYGIEWSQAGNASPLTAEKIKTGWLGNEKPMVEHMNWLLNRIDKAIGYFMQGVRWTAEVEYPANEIVNHDGVLYRSKQTSKGFPVTNTTYWEPAFYSQAGGVNLADEINKIKNTDGYLSKYLKISAPVTTARLEAGSFQANAGLATTSSYNMGYSFDGYPASGMFLNGTTLTFRIGGATKLTVPAADPTLADRTTNLATTDWVQRLIEEKIGNIDMTANRLPVGSVFITINEQNPKDLLGYGTWVRFAEGEVIVGKSTVSAHPAWTKTTLTKSGAYTHQLSVDEMPAHKHAFKTSHESGGRCDVDGYPQTDSSGPHVEHSASQPDMSWLRRDGTGNPMGTTGGSVAHNNVQPSVVANIWRRTA